VDKASSSNENIELNKPELSISTEEQLTSEKMEVHHRP
jgi:hypothetical protein